MNAADFTTDQETGYLDLPNRVAICDGDCDEVFMESQLTSFHGCDLCDDCYPKCGDKDCGEKQHRESDGLCASCELKNAWEVKRELEASKPSPMTDAWFEEMAEADKQVALWTARKEAA